MRYDENNICYLDEFNSDEEANSTRTQQFALPQSPIYSLFPENLEIYCPNCTDFNNFHSYNPLPMPNSFLGTPFFNPAKNNFLTYGTHLNSGAAPIFHNGVNPSFHSFPTHRPADLLFTTPVIVRNSSDLFL